MASMVIANPLIGEWESDEKRTLEDVNARDNIPPKTKAFFENDFFGKLKLTFTENKIFTTYEEFENSGSYEILNETENSITLRAWNDVLKEYEDQTFYIEGNIIYTITSKYKIREYFVKIK
ncbi:MAG: hypothetical protein DRQ59_09990 [Gammaproteobacteria bacterium]|nr:MAG: hypothetical protein DRQ59_09990 [Gammaproteobacteria bacterium]